MDELLDWMKMGRPLTCKLRRAQFAGAWTRWRIGDADIGPTAPRALLAARRIAVRSIVAGLVEYEETGPIADGTCAATNRKETGIGRGGQ